MVRPREFDRDEALEKATQVFWDRGYAGTSTDDLRNAMGIGRQSMYNAFGDKRQLYLEVLAKYQAKSVETHLRRLNEQPSAREGIRAMLKGLAVEDDRVRAMGCFGVGATGEFGKRTFAVDEIAVIEDLKIGALSRHFSLQLWLGTRGCLESDEVGREATGQVPNESVIVGKAGPRVGGGR